MSLTKPYLENNTEHCLRAPNWVTFFLSKHLLNEIEHSREKEKEGLKVLLSHTTCCENRKDSHIIQGSEPKLVGGDGVNQVITDLKFPHRNNVLALKKKQTSKNHSLL